jgi:hypothetical protein
VQEIHISDQLKISTRAESFPLWDPGDDDVNCLFVFCTDAKQYCIELFYFTFTHFAFAGAPLLAHNSLLAFFVGTFWSQRCNDGDIIVPHCRTVSQAVQQRRGRQHKNNNNNKISISTENQLLE